MASLDSYEIPQHLIEFIENEMKGTYFDNMLKSGMITTLLNYAIKNCNFELAFLELEYCNYGKPSVTGYTPLMNLLESHEKLWDNCHWSD